MAYTRAYHDHVEKLVKCLPMDDTHFITKLSAKQLLPGDTENKIKVLSTQAEKASYFLNHVIKPSLDIDETSDFDELLSIMQNCGYKHVEKLAITIKCEIDKLSEIKLQPKEIKSQPDQIRSQTDQIRSQAEQIISHPYEIRSQPDQTRSQSDQTLSQPEQIISQPDQIRSQPDQMIAQPDEIKPEVQSQLYEIRSCTSGKTCHS